MQRHDGWTTERQRAFLEQLADRGSVRAAALAVGMSTTSAYRLRARPEGRAFAAAWDAAIAFTARAIEDTVFERAIDGWDEPVFRNGEQIGTRKRYDNRLLRWLLTFKNPAEYHDQYFSCRPATKVKAGETFSNALAYLDAAAEPPQSVATSSPSPAATTS